MYHTYTHTLIVTTSTLVQTIFDIYIQPSLHGSLAESSSIPLKWYHEDILELSFYYKLQPGPNLDSNCCWFHGNK